MTKENNNGKSALVVRCMRAIGCRLEGSASLAPVMPWIVMSQNYHVFDDELVGDAAPTRRLKQIAGQWERSYKSFNHPLWAGVAGADADELAEMMQEYEDDLHNDIVRLRVCIMAAIPTKDVALKRAIVNAYICRVLALIAQSIYSRVFVSYRRIGRQMVPKPLVNKDLERLEHWAKEWYLQLMRERGVASILYTDEIRRQQDALCKAVVRWQRRKDREEEEGAI